MTQPAVLVLAEAALLVSILVGAQPRPATGTLAQLRGSDGCVYASADADTEPSPLKGLCAEGRALRSPVAAVASADGRHVYVAAAGDDAIAAFRRDAVTGALRQLPGTAGCVSGVEDPACANATPLFSVSALSISRDGRHVYALSPRVGVAVLRRDAATGALAQPPGPAGCVGSRGAEGVCTTANAIDAPAAIALSPDGRNLYIASLGTDDSVAVFARDAVTGSLRQLDGIRGCVSIPRDEEDVPGDSCAPATALDDPASVGVSGDGRHVYVGARATVAVFSRNPATGQLTQLPAPRGCAATADAIELRLLPCLPAKGLGEASAILPTQDGQNVYVASWPVIVDGSAAVSTVATFRRDPASGALAQDADACISELGGECRHVRGLRTEPTLPFNAVTLAGTTDGQTVYVGVVASGQGSGTLSVFARGRGGSLTQLPAAAGCVGSSVDGCTPAKGIQGASAIAVSPEGRNLYATGYWDDAIVAFSRTEPATQLLATLRRDPPRKGSPLAGTATLDVTSRRLCWSLRLRKGVRPVTADLRRRSQRRPLVQLRPPQQGCAPIASGVSAGLRRAPTAFAITVRAPMATFTGSLHLDHP